MLGFRKASDEPDEPGTIREVADESELDAELAAAVAIIFKHSTRCSISIRAFRQIRTFARINPSVPILLVDVVRSRALSDRIAERFEIRHQSPQVILVREQLVAWDASHGSVTAERITEALS